MLKEWFGLDGKVTLAVCLASEASAYMTGEVIRIDDGQSYFTV